MKNLGYSQFQYKTPKEKLFTLSEAYSNKNEVTINPHYKTK